MVFVSIGLRLRTEVEALNMVEAMGAYTKHRTVSVLKRIGRDNKVGYRLIVAPGVSGQAVAHGYHRALVGLARNMARGGGLPVCDECNAFELKGGFPKRATKRLDHDTRVKDCVVEDLTGFMAPEAQVRRTSPVSFSYLVPDVESARISLDSQFHVRYDFEMGEHAPFTIESGTAVYMLSVTVDVDRIGRLEEGGYVENRDKRVELAFKALTALIEGFMYGAKRARYLPIAEVVGAVAAISHPIPFMVSPPRVYWDGRNYIADTINRAKEYASALSGMSESVKVLYMDKEGVVQGELEADGIEVKPVETFSEMVQGILERVRADIGGE